MSTGIPHARALVAWRGAAPAGPCACDLSESDLLRGFHPDQRPGAMVPLVVGASAGQSCPVHGTAVEWKSEENVFFRLSKYQQPLLDHFAAHPDFLQPDVRRNEILSLIKGGLIDISVSRAGQSWGIPLPFDPQSVVYVWFDALINYMSAVGLGTDPQMLASLTSASLRARGPTNVLAEQS